MRLVWILVGIFLIIGLLMIKSQMDPDLSDTQDRKGFVSASLDWIKGLGKNMLSIVGYATTDLDWLPEEDKK